MELAKEESRANGPLLTEAEWDGALQSTGFTGADHIFWDMPDSRYVSTEQIPCLLRVHVWEVPFLEDDAMIGIP